MTFNSFGQRFQEVIPLWPDEIPNLLKTNQKEIQDKGDILWITKVREPTLTVFLPTKALANGKAVLIFPGGGYAGLAFDWEGLDIAKWFNSKGYAAFVVKYRLPEDSMFSDPHVVPLQDAQRAIRMVRSRSVDWNIDPNQIGIIGFSAGGHLASTLGTHFDQNTYQQNNDTSARPDFMILVYPVISFTDPEMHSGSMENLIGSNPDPERRQLYSNELQVSPDTPPTLLIHSSDDEGVPPQNSLLFYKALIDNQVKAELHIYPYGGHGYSLAIGKGHLATWPDRMSDWLESLNP